MSSSPALPDLAAWLVVPPSRERFDGIRDFSAHLAASLGPAARVVTTRDDAHPVPGSLTVGSFGALAALPSQPGAVFVQYMPSAWLRTDTWKLLGWLRQLRRQGTPVVVTFHEYLVDPNGSPRRAVARVAMRALARAFASRASAVVATYGFVESGLRSDGHTNVVRIPVGSNLSSPGKSLPINVTGRDLPEEERYVVMFGQPAQMSAAHTKAVAAALDRGVTLRWICRDDREARAWMAEAGIPPPAIDLRAGLDARDVSGQLAAATVAFAPIVDGVSTRRTTIASFMQHQLAIAGTLARGTDELISNSGAVALSPLEDPDHLAGSVRRLLTDGAERARLAAQARAFYETHLSWESIARQYAALVQ